MNNDEKRPIGEDFEQDEVNNDRKNIENNENGERFDNSNQNSNGNYFGNENQNINKGNYFGNDFPNSTANGYSQNGYGGGYNGDFNGYNFVGNFQEQKNENGRKGLGIASMVLGIISVVCCCLDGYPFVCAVLAIVFSALRMKVKEDGFAIAGLVLGIIGVLFNGFILVLYLTGFMEQLVYEFEQMDSVFELIGAFIRR